MPLNKASGTEENGATLVEFAIVVPLLLLLLFGIVEFGRLVAEFTTVRTAAREGARFATTVEATSDTPHYRDCDGIVAAARSKAVVGTLDSITVTWEAPGGYTFSCSDTTPANPDADEVISGTTIRVAVASDFQSVVPVIGLFLDEISLDSEQTRQVFIGVVESD